MPSARPRSLAMTLGKWTLAVVALAVALPYAWGPIYHFPAPSTFTGAHFFNPYAELRGTWQRANLHAHGRAWSGITNGQQTDEEVVNRYHNLGYSVPGISDYEKIAADHGVQTIPIYEHGYNVGKHHQLAIGAHRVEWFDFLLLQSLSHEQYIIDRVAKGADLVAIAHPSLRDAYSSDDMLNLTGYQLMEVVNGPDEQDGQWDAALSSGHAVWALADDDTHDVNDLRRTGVAWNMIDAPTPGTDDIVAALRAGRTYAVARNPHSTGGGDTTVTAIDMDAGRLVVTCAGEPATFEFIGQNGNIRGTVKSTLTAGYTFDDNDTYIRTVIRAGKTTMYLNPVVRYDGAHIPTPASTVAAGATWLLRGSCALGGLVAIVALRRRRPVPAPIVELSQSVTDRRRKTA
ncbi:MAG TPA: hypothetical protein VHZ73_09635 [Vicinamibacterales bacterium]|nr:hypothetical protein [Vicinamibacterales bacterium]